MSLPDRFQQAQKDFTHNGTPRLSIYRTGGGHISSAAVRQLFGEQPDALFIGADPDADEIGFVPADPDAPDAYVFSSDDGGVGGDIRFGPALDALGIDTSAFDGTQYVPMSKTDDVVVADVSELAESNGTAEDPTPDDSQSEEVNDEDLSPEDLEAQNQARGTDETQDVTEVADGVDADADCATKVRQLLEAKLDNNDSIRTTCGRVGDAVGEDGRTVPHAFKSLDDIVVERTDEEADNGASIWMVSKVDDEPQTDIDTGEGEPDRPTTDDVKYWCGRCGQGPFDSEVHIEGHHDRRGHDGEEIVRAIEPTEDELLTNDVPLTVEDKPLQARIEEFLDWETPGSRYFKTADIAIACDGSGNRVEELLLSLGDSGDWEIARDGSLWQIDPAGGGEA